MTCTKLCRRLFQQVYSKRKIYFVHLPVSTHNCTPSLKRSGKMPGRFQSAELCTVFTSFFLESSSSVKSIIFLYLTCNFHQPLPPCGSLRHSALWCQSVSPTVTHSVTVHSEVCWHCMTLMFKSSSIHPPLPKIHAVFLPSSISCHSIYAG